MKNKISGHIVRRAAYAVFLSVAFIAASSASNSFNTRQRSTATTGAPDPTGKTPSQPRAFRFAERVAFQRAIEDVYWRHRIWPRTRGENPDPKPSLDAVMSQAQLENKVADYLRDSLTLQDYWQRSSTAEQLQAEMDRMARDTKQSEVLRELFEARGNDPAVIAECLARPILAEHLIADFSMQDQTRHVESPQSNEVRATSVATTLGQVIYTLPEIADTCTDDSWTATTTANAPFGRSGHTAIWTGNEMIVWGDGGPSPQNTGGRHSAEPPPSLTVIEPNGGEVWSMGSVHEIKWKGGNLRNSDRLIIQYSRTGGVTWFRIARDVPALSFSYSWHVDNYPTTQGRVKILLQGNRSITDESDANFTVQRP